MKEERTYSNRRRAAAAMILSALLLWMVMAPFTAYAFVEEDANSETVIVEENIVEETEDTPFSISGNGEVLDDITDEGSKEFFTITTKNGSTYFLVIDRSSTAENVYLLSMIDEYDLQDFLEETEASLLQTEEVLTETEAQAAVIIPETAAQAETEETETEGVIEEDEPGTTFLLLMVAAGVIIAGVLYFYFKVYRPGEEEDSGESENMEMDTEDFSTERDSEDDEE
ncbi:MAG: DUF4366 domain-containing protein [Lachnospiraceae bacterium]|nr:DUF4366 domain-containing protein [Lachnospiraceae bacterium]